MRVDDLERAVAALALDHHVLSAAEAIRVISTARNSDKPLARVLLEAVGEMKILEAVASELELPWVDLYATGNAYQVDEDLVRMCDIDMLKDHNALPLRGPAGEIAVAMANPRADQDMVDYLRGRLPERPVLVLAPTAQIQAKLVYFGNTVYDGLEGPDEDAGRALPTTVNDNPVVEWVDNLLARAVAEGASDVQFMFLADGSLMVRFSVDGTWRRQEVPLRRREREIVGTVLSKCATIDASDRTRPQDGTFSFASVSGRQIDARLGMLPQAYGPTVVCRILDPANINRRLDDMGFAKSTLDQMRRVVRAPQGAVFMIGPTGSGKTTTLYGLLKELPAETLNIYTAEDPIEYRLPFIGQTQIRSDLGERSLTFAKTLRAFMRLAPNVILVGEVRDAETAEVSMHAAMTGHLVLSTVHAKSAIGVFTRLEELGVEPYLASEALSLAVNQRLIRRVHDCATLEPPDGGEVAFLTRHGLAVPPVVPRKAKNGCAGCNGTGYRGRIAVVEVLEPTAEVRTMVAEKRSPNDILRAAQGEGYTSILSDAHRHVMEGSTTVAELLRCIDTGGL